MNNEIYEKLFAQFTGAMQLVPSADGLGTVKALSASLATCREYLSKLRSMALGAPFVDQLSEIAFFKLIKTKFYAEQIFAFECYGVEANRPVGTLEMVRGYLEDELRLVHRYFSRYAFLYQYYRSGAVELDTLYFVRGARLPSAMVVEVPDPDPEFSTAMDYLFSRFIALERLQVYLLEALVSPDALPLGGAGQVRKRRELRWTGDSINAVELGFGLHDSGQLNDGQASLTDIFDWMADTLHIEIKKPHRRFSEIEGRKIISKTDFSDRLRTSILNRIDSKNEYDPLKEQQRALRAETRRKASEKKALEKQVIGKDTSGNKP